MCNMPGPVQGIPRTILNAGQFGAVPGRMRTGLTLAEIVKARANTIRLA
jgi:hypothetical protein